MKRKGVDIMKQINLNDQLERNFYGISSEYAAQLQKDGYTVEYGHHTVYPSYEEVEEYLIYNQDGDLVEELTYEEISSR